MPPPLFAVLRHGQQSVDDFLKRLGRVVIHKGRHLTRRGRQSGEIVIRAPNELAFVSEAVGRQFFCFQFVKDERVNGAAAPVGVGHLGHGRTLDFLIGPVSAGAGIDLRVGQLMRRVVPGDFQLGIKRRAQLHPLRKHVDFLLRQLCLGRHLVVAVAIRNHVEQQTLLRLLEINGRPDFAALEQPRTTGEAEMSLELFLPTVALETALLQNRENFLVKKLNLRRVGQLLRRQRNRQRQRAH